MALSPCSLTGFQGSRDDQRSKAKRRQDEPEDEPRTLLVRPFCSAGLRPSLRPVLGSTPLRGVSRKVSKGGVPSPWPRHTVHPPIGSELRHPSPFSPSATTIRLKIQAGEIRVGVSGGRNSGGRCPSAGAPAAATPLPSPVPRRLWPRGACKMASGEDGGGVCVEGGVVV